VASLVGDGESGDSLVDENEPIHPLQQPETEDYTDPNWEPEPIDAGPGKRYRMYTIGTLFDQETPQISGRTSPAMSSVR
jgi:hypothetical protein